MAPVSGMAGHYLAMADAAERFLRGRDAPATPVPTAADIDALVAARLAEADPDIFAPIPTVRALQSPPITFASWTGPPLFVAEDIPRLAAIAGLPAPTGDHASLAEGLFGRIHQRTKRRHHFQKFGRR